MSDVGLCPWDGSTGPDPRSVPVTVVVLAQDEERTISRCLGSVGWAEQVLVVDGGSRDATVRLAERAGAELLRHAWPGFGAQREWALRHPAVRHDWVFFVDADEWTSPELATEVAQALSGQAVAYALRFRLVFQGRWVRHCGWYGGSWLVRLLRRDRVSFPGSSTVGERAVVTGPVGRLCSDIVDEDRKGLAAWLEKHVRYARLEAERRSRRAPQTVRLRGLLQGRREVPLARRLLKDVVYPAVPAKPLLLFLYMFVLRGGFLDGVVGLRFCLLHAWHEYTVGLLVRELTGPERRT